MAVSGKNARQFRADAGRGAGDERDRFHVSPPTRRRSAMRSFADTASRSAAASSTSACQKQSGAAFDGSRLSKLYAEDLEHGTIVAALDPIFAAYATDRQKGERFGDFTIRAGFVAATGNGRDFHANVGVKAERAAR